MSDGWSLSAGPRLVDLSDTDLHLEAQRRRRLRRGETPTTAPRDSRQVAQWLANLELPQRASRQQVEEAYQDLVKRYETASERAKGKKKHAAETLLSSLGEAYKGLLTYFDR